MTALATTYKPLGNVVPGTARAAFTVSNKALTSNVATLTTGAAHGLAVGDIVEVAGVDSTFDGIRVVASVPTSTTFTFACTASNVSSVAVSPVAPGWLTHHITGFAASNKLAVNGLVTITTGTHTLAAKDWIYVNVGDATIDGWRQVWAVPSTTLVCFKVPGASIASAACGGAVGKASSTWVNLLSGAVPASTKEVISTVLICNGSDYPAAVRVAMSTSTTPTVAERVLFDRVLDPGETFPMTIGLTMDTGKYLMCQASQPEVTFSASTAEIA